MFTIASQGEPTPKASFANGYEPPTTPQKDDPNRIRHMLTGAPTTVKTTIRQLHQLGYAEVNDWSRPLATGKADEVTCILIKRVQKER